MITHSLCQHFPYTKSDISALHVHHRFSFDKRVNSDLKEGVSMTEAKILLSRMMMKPTTITGACCIAALLPFSIHAAADLGEGLLSLAPSKVLLNADGSRDHWNGIGRINSRSGSNCTATLIDTRSADSTPDAPAYALTSGHCISRQNGLIITDGEIEGSVQFNFSLTAWHAAIH
ncbi:Trypsin domain protein [Pseudomonas amygdali pv. eriobotryae]|nr:Trypsin domain protein [Pseudomonas syringae pv. cunninghamiae]KPX34723.1 Trypsin domain protein [Pseudomonas amygdali pv. eriobotryae]KPX53741.1 Trypsin domain protein [Pseudomonas amygdali pv. photiniae]KPZ08677.1 Trypsin domain protein [Pseudomonas amygdali pv. ulmi]RMV10568.1 Trypsin domain protein [Pseudomonas savastanoi]